MKFFSRLGKSQGIFDWLGNLERTDTLYTSKLNNLMVKLMVSHSLVAIGGVLVRGTADERWGPSLSAALSFPNSKQVPIYCWIDRVFLLLEGKARV